MGTLRDDVLHALEHEEREGDLTRARFRFAPELPVFAGHFPGTPIVPGVYLLEAARVLSERTVGGALRIASIDEAKFTARVLPDEEIVVEHRLTGARAACTCRATVTAGGSPSARLRMSFVAEERGAAEGAGTCNE